MVSSIGYCAFLAGPPLIGLLAEHAGILRALFVVLGALVVGLLCAGAARPLGGSEPGRSPGSHPKANPELRQPGVREGSHFELVEASRVIRTEPGQRRPAEFGYTQSLDRSIGKFASFAAGIS